MHHRHPNTFPHRVAPLRQELKSPRVAAAEVLATPRSGSPGVRNSARFFLERFKMKETEVSLKQQVFSKGLLCFFKIK